MKYLIELTKCKDRESDILFDEIKNKSNLIRTKAAFSKQKKNFSLFLLKHIFESSNIYGCEPGKSTNDHE